MLHHYSLCYHHHLSFASKLLHGSWFPRKDATPLLVDGRLTATSRLSGHPSSLFAKVSAVCCLECVYIKMSAFYGPISSDN